MADPKIGELLARQRKAFVAEGAVTLELRKARLQKAIDMLIASGWRVATIWECALKGHGRLSPEAAIDSLTRWICSGDQRLTLERLNTETGDLS